MKKMWFGFAVGAILGYWAGVWTLAIIMSGKIEDMERQVHSFEEERRRANEST